MSYGRVLKGARLVDLGCDRVVRLPDWDYLTIGLTVNDQLTCVLDEFGDNDLILGLFYIEKLEDGHWIIPNPHLPCLYNDDEISEPTLVSHGSTIRVGDRYLRYQLGSKAQQEQQQPPGTISEGKPPPKPKRSVAFIIPPDDVHSQDESWNGQPMGEVEDAGSGPGSPLGEEWCMVPAPTIDEELIAFASTPAQVPQMAASYIIHQIMVYTDTEPSTEDIDTLFRVIEEITNGNEDLVINFLLEYNSELRDKDSSSPTHGPIILLLADFLRQALEPLEHTEMWMFVLSVLSRLVENLSLFTDHQVAPVVMGAMAANASHKRIQEHGCHILAQLATIQPDIPKKGPIRESAVELMVLAMKSHPRTPGILRPALRALTNIIHTYSILLETVLEWDGGDEEELSSELVVELMARWLGLLDFINSVSATRVQQVVADFPSDDVIQNEGHDILSFFNKNQFGLVRSVIPGNDAEAPLPYPHPPVGGDNKEVNISADSEHIYDEIPADDHNNLNIKTVSLKSEINNPPTEPPYSEINNPPTEPPYSEINNPPTEPPYSEIPLSGKGNKNASKVPQFKIISQSDEEEDRVPRYTYAKVDLSKKRRKNNVEKRHSETSGGVAMLEVSDSQVVNINEEIHSRRIIEKENDLIHNTSESDSYETLDEIMEKNYMFLTQERRRVSQRMKEDDNSSSEDELRIVENDLYETISLEDPDETVNKESTNKGKFLSLKRQRARIKELKHVASDILKSRKAKQKVRPEKLEKIKPVEKADKEVTDKYTKTSKRLGIFTGRFNRKKETIPVIENNLYTKDKHNLQNSEMETEEESYDSMNGAAICRIKPEMGLDENIADDERVSLTQSAEKCMIGDTMFLTFTPSESSA